MPFFAQSRSPALACAAKGSPEHSCGTLRGFLSELPGGVRLHEGLKEENRNTQMALKLAGSPMHTAAMP